MEVRQGKRFLFQMSRGVLGLALLPQRGLRMSSSKVRPFQGPLLGSSWEYPPARHL